MKHDKPITFNVDVRHVHSQPKSMCIKCLFFRTPIICSPFASLFCNVTEVRGPICIHVFYLSVAKHSILWPLANWRDHVPPLPGQHKLSTQIFIALSSAYSHNYSYVKSITRSVMLSVRKKYEFVCLAIMWSKKPNDPELMFLYFYNIFVS